ncbi:MULTISPECIES: sulfatase [unclassified Lentimonas]|uniref:sulfatase n=1 Tax=unclassified Lentimonas TaxID=2630993 RepID=UPI00132B254A|nr:MULTISPECIES: sulfatase [unclassified Lentimonas]CAA6679322.1 Choline-sulfatase (EC [Lentimonas sp. CC4]CAA6686359.1 Choline-sulfatase (EC [Lentimonas sp. CC6]CAA7076133.1 Choline-sulfatase (EC [Lentimonas sp. CC4]CAA7170874.1 Choline-sulfatase (EC [Lentimonas sp. CC21]CAA7181184.1 Choline-sulfatase (EC [Lentimonas sp. CC8]
MKLKSNYALLFLLLSQVLCAASSRPNVLFLSVDDLNDWINPMGHSQAITPNMDRLAARGVTYQNAHTAGSFCAPSRTAIFTGRYATTTGFYHNQVYHFENPEIVPLHMAFHNAGYATYGAGKLFHHAHGFIDRRAWDEFYIRDDELKKRGWGMETWKEFHHDMLPDPYPASPYNIGLGRAPTNGFFLEWGPIPNEKEERMADTMRTNYAVEVLQRQHDEPFFLGLGLYAPHFPNYVPQKYFDLYDRDAIVPPVYLQDDWDDLPEKPRKRLAERRSFQERIENLDIHKDAIRGYLASVTYADAMLGRVLDALDASPYRDNTVIVLWSDNGYHLGEKMNWGKETLWQRTSNVPLIFAGPGIARGASLETSASLVDMYPTLLDLCRLPQEDGLDGVSMARDLRYPERAQDRAVMLPGTEPNEYAIMNQKWRYIRYRDGGEELYDVCNDPHEWTNLADSPEYASVKRKMAAEAPSDFAEPRRRKHRLNLVIEGDDFHWEKK